MKLLRVRQKLASCPIADVGAAVHAALDRLELRVPQGEMAVTVGSRGIANYPTIIKAVGDWLRQRGAHPFIFPAMGSHNGGTAEGQRAMIESLGITESAVDMPIRATMDVEKLGTVATGDVWMDRNAFHSAGVLVVNRIKLHTCFSGPVQSGVTKMMVVGMGKTPTARTFHAAPNHQLAGTLLGMGQVVLRSGKIWAGLAILEDGYDQTAEFHAMGPDEIQQREPELLERARYYFPKLPLDDINVLVVDTIGKTYSGTGMDTNVIGHRAIRGFEDLDRPRIEAIAALSLCAASQGNAVGIGLADFITRRLRDAMDEQKTFLNAFTTGYMQRVKIPMTFDSDQHLIEALVGRYGTERWLIVANTQQLDTLYASEDLREELSAHPLCTVEPEPVELTFAGGRHQLVFEPR